VQRPDRARGVAEVDGTISFVDISGFTAMSERLSNIGRARAKEVTDVMNATFSALLDVAYATVLYSQSRRVCSSSS
jgi:class 3 adenylate cyclase